MKTKTQILKIVGVAFICFVVVLPRCVQAQMSDAKFRTVNRVVSLDKKSTVIQLNEADSVGIAWILDKQFTKGEIEFDVKGIDKFQGSFVGMAFHSENDTTYQAVYFRPFNFRAADPMRKSHAVQYMSHPKYDWPFLRAQFPGKYEKGILSDIDPNDWFHVRLVITDRSVRVYTNGSKVPVFETKLLGQTQGTMIGYWVGHGSGGAWKNLKIMNVK